MDSIGTILDSIHERPDDPAQWQAYAYWLAANGRDDESDAVRVYWPTLVENIASGVSVEDTLKQLTAYAKVLGKRAREIEERGGTP